MKVVVALTIAAFCVVACVAETSETREKRQAPKPGRFLSLPVPAKCATRKYLEAQIKQYACFFRQQLHDCRVGAEC